MVKGYIDTGKWAHSKNLAEVMASSRTTKGMTRVKKKRTKNLGTIYVVQKWS